MQLIEVSDLWVRSAQIRLQRRGTPMRFVLFPMLHLGAPSFYEDVTRRLRACDLVVAEGIHGRSLTASALVLTYELFGRVRRDGLVVQRIDYRALGVPAVSPDMSASEFGKGWRRLPLTLRLAVWTLVPLYALGMLFFGSREVVARNAEVDDLPTREEAEVAGDEHVAPFWRLLVDDRDAHRLASSTAQVTCRRWCTT